MRTHGIDRVVYHRLVIETVVGTYRVPEEPGSIRGGPSGGRGKIATLNPQAVEMSNGPQAVEMSNGELPCGHVRRRLCGPTTPRLGAAALLGDETMWLTACED